MNDNAITTARSVFLHREIFHLKPRKDDLFHAHLSRQYNDTTTSQNDLLSQPLPRNEDNAANRNTNRERNVSTNNRRSIIDTVRQMNGCYSFEIYRRTDNPLEDHEGHGEENEEERTSQQDNGILSCSSASPEPALSSDSSSHIQPALDATTSKPTSLFLLERKEENQNDETAAAESSGSNETPTQTKNNRLVEAEATSEYGHLKKTPAEEEETKEKKDPVGRLPHQFMVLGRWESSASYYLFYVNRAVQKFFCPLISRKVIMSLPILTMWQKENGVHRQMHYSTLTEGLRNSEGGNLHPTVPLSVSDSSSNAVGNDTPNHFVMSRKRVLKDPSNMSDALTIAKGLASSAMKEDGCLAYDVCKTGNTMFNENEILEIGIWESPHHFVLHNKQSYRGLHLTLHQLFDISQEETSFWERPNFSPIKSSDKNK